MCPRPISYGMSLIFKIALASHVLLGIVGVIALYAIWMGLLKKDMPLVFLKRISLVGFLSIIMSWFAGGYYYVFYYGGIVKPVIKEGAYPWAHLIFTETKEHIFLVLPFVSLVLVLLFWCIGDKLKNDQLLKKSAMWFVGAATLIGVFVTIAGIVISGGVQ